jgi:hypothetical protein
MLSSVLNDRRSGSPWRRSREGNLIPLASLEFKPDLVLRPSETRPQAPLNAWYRGPDAGTKTTSAGSAVSHDYHRYGNLGARNDEKRRPVL